ncbi:PA0061/PA0062 family lipoprotein [Pseudomonas gingeri]
MRKLLSLLALASLGGCISPLPAVDPQMAWIDVGTRTGTLVMAESVDKKRLDDGRFFQVTPGAHELTVRFDFDVYVGGMAMNTDPLERICYITVPYDHFEAGRRYRLEGVALGFQANARLYNDKGEQIAGDRTVLCMP